MVVTMDSEDEERVKTARVLVETYGNKPEEDCTHEEKRAYRSALRLLTRHVNGKSQDGREE